MSAEPSVAPSAPAKPAQIVARGPSWVSLVAVAIISFIGLSLYLDTAPAVPGEWLFSLDSSARTVARWAKWLIPGFCLLAALAVADSTSRLRRQQALFQRVAADGSPGALEAFDWSDFEGLTAEVFRRKGYRVVQRGGARADGGVDLEAYFGDNRYLVQCKQWKARQVGVSIVRELFGIVAAEGAAGGFVVTSGSFTQDAKAFAKGRPLILVDARELRKQIGGKQATFCQADELSLGLAPTCPVCGSAMVSRPSKRGLTARSRFWGCSRYPVCRGTRA